ncbi:MAG: exodeoxyribonuclease V subunit gamma, partial [Propionibacteriaceae bacterium]
MSLPHKSSGVQLVLAAQVPQIASDLAQRLSSARQDPFAHDLVIVPDAGMGRVLSQELARHLGTSGTGDGVSAGIAFPTISSWLPQLDEMLTGEPYYRRPWQARQLAWQIAQALDDCRHQDWARQLMTYYPDSADSTARPGRRMYRARFLAQQYRRYLRDCPDLLAQWAEGKNTDDTQDQWQAELWRVLLAQFGTDPVAHHQSLLTELRARPVSGLPQQLAIIVQDSFAIADREIIEALGTHHDIAVYLLSTQLRGLSLEQCDAFGSAERELQQQWSSLSTASPRQLVQPHHWKPRVTVHECYGQDRQVDVLRDALLRILTERPDLEPRDIVVHCADIASFAPRLPSAFAIEQDLASPAAQLRVRLAVPDPHQPNPVFTLLDELLVLATTRADTSEMLSLLSQPVVMARFGWTHDSLHRMEELITMAQIRWGINQHHCQLFGLTTEQNTWSAGIDRLIAGIALDETIHTSVGRALPLDDISAQDVPLIGALADIMTVLGESISFTHTTHSLTDWLTHCRSLLTALMSVTPETSADLAQVYGVLNDLAETSDHATSLGLGDFRVLLRGSIPTRARRTVAGTGSLMV